jgi:hypothetical protein
MNTCVGDVMQSGEDRGTRARQFHDRHVQRDTVSASVKRHAAALTVPHRLHLAGFADVTGN